MAINRMWKYGIAITGGAALALLGVVATGASAASAPMAEQWGTVASVTYHETATSAAPTMFAVVELFDGRRFVHVINSTTSRIPAPGEVWNIANDAPPAGWKARK